MNPAGDHRVHRILLTGYGVATLYSREITTAAQSAMSKLKTTIAIMWYPVREVAIIA